MHFVGLICNDYITVQGVKKKKLNTNFDKSLHIKCKAGICINIASQNNTSLQKIDENNIRCQKYWENDRAIHPETEADND